MRSDVWHLHSVNIVVPANHTIEPMLPMHCHKWISRIIIEKESGVTINHLFQLRWFSVLNNSLEHLCHKQGIEGKDSSDIHGTVKKYPIGTVAKVDVTGKHFYFVAVNDVNKYGKPINQQYNNVNTALKGLLEAIPLFGHCDDIAMPLIGTGKAAIREATLENVVENTVNSFVNSQDKIARKLTIRIRPKDYLEEKLDLKQVGKYIDYKCEFK